MAKEITVDCEVTFPKGNRRKKKDNSGCGCLMLFVCFFLFTSTITGYMLNHRLEHDSLAHALVVLALGCLVFVLLALVICWRGMHNHACEDSGWSSLPYPLNKYV